MKKLFFISSISTRESFVGGTKTSENNFNLFGLIAAYSHADALGTALTETEKKFSSLDGWKNSPNAAETSKEHLLSVIGKAD